jgi:type VI secretion system protein VasJ
VPVEYDALRARAEPWLAPIAGASPTGASARFDQEYLVIAEEVGKLDAPAGGEVNWKQIVQDAGKMLQKRSKDLVIAVYLAHALHVTDGPGGLLTGMVLITESIERYWDTMFPEAKRPRGRANALQWLMEKTAIALQTASPGTLEEMEGLEVVVRRLSQVTREKLRDLCPAFGPVLDPVVQLKAAATPPEPPPPPPPKPDAGAAPGPSDQAAAAPAAPTVEVAAPAAPATAADALDFLRNVGSSLASAAVTMRQADAADAQAYRILRIGLWLHLVSAPPAAGGKTQIPPPPEPLRNQLAALVQNQKWLALIEETESAAMQHRFWLDLHRMSWQALSALGSSHERARDAVAAEVRSLLARMPLIPTLSFGDGMPLADPQTRSWIEDQLQAASATPARNVGATEDSGLAERLAEAKKLFAGGQAGEALALLRDEAERRRSGRARFLVRVEMARLAAGAGLAPVAKALYEELDREATEHRLDEWEPAIAAECLKGYLAAARALSKDPRGASPDLTDAYRRLCRVDPAAAHEVWP